MPFLPAYLLMAQSEVSRLEVSIANRRPSVVAANARFVPATLVPNDEKGIVVVTGTNIEVEQARKVLKTLDQPRKKLRLRVTVESPADHLTWEVEAKLTNGQRWKTADDETKAEIALEPLVQNDGTLSLTIIAHSGKQMLQTSLRIKKGQAQTFDLGSRLEQDIAVGGEKNLVTREERIPLPKVTIRYL